VRRVRDIALIVFGLVPAAFGQTNDWINTFGGSWQTGSFWSLGVPPTNTQSAILITNAATKTVSINSKTSADLLTISNLTVSAPVGSVNTLLLDNAGSLTPLIVLSNLTVNSGGAVKLTNSALVVNNRSVGLFAVDGAMTLDGDSSLVVSGRIEVARATNGNLTVNNGTVTAQVGLFAGESSGATGTVWVTGGQMLINGQNGSVLGSAGGAGQVTISNGTMQVVSFFVGRSSGAESTITVPGGTLELLTFCRVGADAGGTGTVWVSGGTVIATNASLSLGANGTGRMIVSNGVVRTGTVGVGAIGSFGGELTVAGGEMSVLSALTVGNSSCTITATVLLADGELFVTNAAHNATLTIQSGTFTQSGGTLTVDNVSINSACARFIRTGGTLIVNGSITANSAYDTDGDGIPNSYEDSHGFDKFNPADATQDADGDGLSNLQEYLAGTDATNSASAFRVLSVAKESNDIRVTWMTGPGKTNALQKSPGGSYNTNNFTDIFVVTNTTGTVTNYLDLDAGTTFPPRFYRVRLVP
jgi:hypothetical protein